MKTNEEINIYLYKKIEPDECWFAFDKKDVNHGVARCLNCGGIGKIHINPDYFSKDGFWDVWEWCKKQEWWTEFYSQQLSNVFLGVFVNYKTFAREVYDFLEDKK